MFTYRKSNIRPWMKLWKLLCLVIEVSASSAMLPNTWDRQKENGQRASNGISNVSLSIDFNSILIFFFNMFVFFSSIITRRVEKVNWVYWWLCCIDLLSNNTHPPHWSQIYGLVYGLSFVSRYKWISHWERIKRSL